MSVRIIHGDCIKVLKALPPDSVDIIVTSPPYWGLRDYQVKGQLGLEATLGEHLEKMVEVFREIRRVLKPTGTVWINYGDCYATTVNGKKAAAYKAEGKDDRTHRDKPFSTIGPINRARRIPRGKGRWGGGNAPAGGALKPKDLCMVPNRLAIALQEDGWWVRSEIVWGKTNPKPDSTRDRPGVAHEKIWLLSKSEKYFYDRDAVLMNLRPKTLTTYGNRRQSKGNDGTGKVCSDGFAKRMPVRKARAAPPRHHNPAWNHVGLDAVPRGAGRYLRNYEPAPIQAWEIATRPFPEAHFATFPPELAARCIMLGCPRGGVVLDPFGGAGTTGLAADILGRDSIMIELSRPYIDLAARRIRAVRRNCDVTISRRI